MPAFNLIIVLLYSVNLFVIPQLQNILYRNNAVSSCADI